MHAAPFDYHRAESVDDAIQLLEETDDGRLLAGGQALIPLLKKREIAPGTLVDIGGIDELRGITETDTGIQVGALTTHREITESPLIASVAPVLPATVSKITGGIQVHNVATIGGNIARADGTSVTRTLTTAIQLEARQGRFGLALTLGAVLLALVLLVNGVLLRLGGRRV